MIPFIEVFRIGKPIETENRFPWNESGGVNEKWGVTVDGYEAFWRMGMKYSRISGDPRTTL